MSKSKGSRICISGKKEIAVAYIRITPGQEDHGLSLPAQESLLRDYAACKNFDLVGIYRDDTSVFDVSQTGSEQMLGYLRKHPECKNLLVERRRDALCRNLKALMKFGEIHDLVIHNVKK